MRRLSYLLAAGLVAACCGPDSSRAGWQVLDRALPALGHRNWIAVADAAYPEQVGAGIETVYVGGDHLTAVTRVLRAVDRAPHVRAVVVLDEELEHLSDGVAPGIVRYRERLAQVLLGRPLEREKHGEVIRVLEEAASSFRVLVLKTDMTLPYTSVFLRLECGYWGDEDERALRRVMAGSAPGGGR